MNKIKVLTIKKLIILLFFSLCCFLIFKLNTNASTTYTETYSANSTFHNPQPLVDYYYNVLPDTMRNNYPYFVIVSRCETNSNPSINCNNANGYKQHLLISKSPFYIGNYSSSNNYLLRVSNYQTDFLMSGSSLVYYADSGSMAGIQSYTTTLSSAYNSSTSSVFLLARSTPNTNLNYVNYRMITYSNHDIYFKAREDLLDYFLIPFSFPRTSSSAYFSTGQIFHYADTRYIKKYTFNSSNFDNLRIDVNASSVLETDGDYKIGLKVTSDNLEENITMPRVYDSNDILLKAQKEGNLYGFNRYEITDITNEKKYIDSDIYNIYTESNYYILEYKPPLASDVYVIQDFSNLVDDVNVTVEIYAYRTFVNSLGDIETEYLNDTYFSVSLNVNKDDDNWLFPPTSEDDGGLVLNPPTDDPSNIGEWFMYLFIPQKIGEYFNNVKEAFLSRVPIFDDFNASINALLGNNIFDDYEPNFTITIPQLNINKPMKVIDFSFYSQYRPIIFDLIKFISWGLFLIWVSKHLPAIFGGGGR